MMKALVVVQFIYINHQTVILRTLHCMTQNLEIQLQLLQQKETFIDRQGPLSEEGKKL